MILTGSRHQTLADISRQITTQNKTDGTAVELSSSLLTLLTGKTSADTIYTPTFEPDGGWDAWCAWAVKQGKIARILRSLAKNTMSFDFEGEDDAALELVKTLARKTHLTAVMIRAYLNWQTYGRCIIEPVWELSEAGRELSKLKLVAPQTIKVFRDNESDVTQLKEFLAKTEYAGYASELETGTGDEVIGFVQFWMTEKATFFMPEELIFIPRYPDHDTMDGISLLRENYTTIMNKLGLEKSQMIMARRHIDPKFNFKLSPELWGKRKEMMAAIENGIKAGMNFWTPEGIETTILESQGNPTATMRAQDHIEDQFIAGMGFADSFTESGSSNRSVGEIQLQFLERDLLPERELFAEILEDRLIHPSVKEKLGDSVIPPTFVFTDLTPREETTWAQAMTAYLPYMTDSQKKKLFEELGYPVAEGDALPSPQSQPTGFNMATQKGVPKPVVSKSAEARGEFTEEIQRLKDELIGAFGN